MFARRIAFTLVHHLVRGKVCKLVIGLVFVVKQDLWTCVRVGPASRRDDDVGVARVPASRARCEDGVNETHFDKRVRSEREPEGTGLDEGIREMEERRL